MDERLYKTLLMCYRITRTHGDAETRENEMRVGKAEK